MNKKLYELMDWPEIEAVVYSEEKTPYQILGPQIVKHGILVQAFIPEAKSVSLILEDEKKEFPMELIDDDGFYAVLLPKRKIIPKYLLEVEGEEGSIKRELDPYSFQIDLEDEFRDFFAGIDYEIYNKLGAHPKIYQGVSGIEYCIWAPNAVRVSLIGSFNNWDGRRHQMEEIEESGIFAIFIPNQGLGELYKFELKGKAGQIIIKSDPFGFSFERNEEKAALTVNMEEYKWKDKEWGKTRRHFNEVDKPISIYELQPGKWNTDLSIEENACNYKSLAPLIANYMKGMGFTHLSLMPIMEYLEDDTLGFSTFGFYAPTSRYGTTDDFKFFIDYLHQQKIPVLLNWCPGYFADDTKGMKEFDGTALYEHQDWRQGNHPKLNAKIFQFGRPEVSNFLVSNGLFWMKEYHLDGIIMNGVSGILYADYDRKDGEWIPNIYGGKENLEGIEFIKHFTSIAKKYFPNCVLIAKEDSGWPMVTGNLDENGLGFDYKLNISWAKDFIEYMQCDPIYRSALYHKLIMGMLYHYTDKTILAFTDCNQNHGYYSMLNEMPGDREKQFANLRIAFGFLITHPGKKMMVMGQEIAQIDSGISHLNLNWEILKKNDHLQFQEYIKDLLLMYKENQILHSNDYNVDGFEWINNISVKENILIFSRKEKSTEEGLVILCNFTPVAYGKYRMGVPVEGCYKEVFSSDEEKYGGIGITNPLPIETENIPHNGRENSIQIKVPSLGFTIFTYTKASITTKEKTKKVSGEDTVSIKEKLSSQAFQLESDEVFIAEKEAKSHIPIKE